MLLKVLKQITWPWLLLTIVVFLGLVKLALWQKARAEFKQARLERIEQYHQQQAFSLSDIEQFINQQGLASVNDMPVTLHGRFNASWLFLHDNQIENKQFGYRVLQVLELGQKAVLVNLGWLKGNVDRSKLPELQSLTGLHQFRANVRLIEKHIQLNDQLVEDLNPYFRLQQIDLNQVSKIISKKLLPFVVYLDKKETIGYKKNWQVVVMPPEKHAAYSFQWFSLAVAWLVLMFALLFRQASKSAEAQPNSNKCVNKSGEL